ncbi:MAG: type II secretion system protein M [Deltaproteobacteria bacterium]|nr:type II secretion system protein M [Deltaproteobacteria bacterium]
MRFSPRERVLLGLGGAFVAAFLFWIALWEPAHKHLALLDRKVQAKQTELREIQELAQKYANLQRANAATEQRLQQSQNVSVLSYLENIAIRQKLRDKISQMRAKGGEATRYYQENAVQIKMEQITLQDLVGYLYELANPRDAQRAPGYLRIRQLQIHQRPESKNLLDVNFQVSAYESVVRS